LVKLKKKRNIFSYLFMEKKINKQYKKMERVCPTCSKTVEAGLYGMKLECNHWVHTKCMDKSNPNFEKCGNCLSSPPNSSPQASSMEADSLDGRDYIANPVSSAGWMYKLIKKEPFIWLQEHKKLQWIMNEKGYGLQKLIQSGVSINDFLQNGYTWDDLKIYKGIQERPIKALKALKCNAEHFREYPIKGKFEIDGRSLVEDFGLVFPPGGKPLVCAGGENKKPWIAKELAELGFKIKDLYGAGMEYVEQYAALYPTDDDEVLLEVKDSDIDALPSIVKRTEEARKVLNPAPLPVASPVYQERIEILPVVEPAVIMMNNTAGPRIHGLRRK
jgi:hypothetical protein